MEIRCGKGVMRQCVVVMGNTRQKQKTIWKNIAANHMAERKGKAFKLRLNCLFMEGSEAQALRMKSINKFNLPPN